MLLYPLAHPYKNVGQLKIWLSHKTWLTRWKIKYILEHMFRMQRTSHKHIFLELFSILQLSIRGDRGGSYPICCEQTSCNM